MGFRRLGAVFFIFPFLWVAGCTKNSSPNPDIIRIGEVSSLTGSEATFGTSNHRGVELAVKYVNTQGGIAGKSLEVIAFDTRGKPEEAALGATRLITQDKVIALIGEQASSRSLSMAPIAQQHQTPMITPSSTNPKVTEVGNFVFRTCFIDPFQGKVMAKFVVEKLKLKRVAILRDIKSDYSIGLAEVFTREFKALGGTIAGDRAYSGGDIDYKAQLTAVRGDHPEGIYVPGYYSDIALMARQAKGLGLNIPLLGGDGWDSPKLREIAGTTIDGSYFSTQYAPEIETPQNREFISQFKLAYGLTPDTNAVLGYDAVMVLVDALKRAKNLDGESVRKALAEMRDFEGATGKMTFDANRNAIKAAVIMKLSPAGFVYQGTVNP